MKKETLAEKALHAELQKSAVGCIASVSTRGAAKKLRMSRNSITRILRAMEKQGKVERLGALTRGGAETYHLKKACEPGGPCGKRFAQLREARKQSDYKTLEGGGPKMGSKKEGVATLFSTGRTESEAKEICEECLGTGWKPVPRPDGEPGIVVVKCAHDVAQIAGRWALRDSAIVELFLRENEVAQFKEFLKRQDLKPATFQQLRLVR
jgi:DNA-binding Lrp family transcriptional regulator